MFAPRKTNRLSQTGDTIIEVLIAIAVASSVLAITYATMNRNLLIVQDNQERTEASKIAQGQIEALRQLTSLPSLGNNFCIKSDGITTQAVVGAPSTLLAGDDFTKYPAECTAGFYRTAITTSDLKTYKIYVRWDNVGGKSRDQVIMVYKI